MGRKHPRKSQGFEHKGAHQGSRSQGRHQNHIVFPQLLHCGEVGQENGKGPAQENGHIQCLPIPLGKHGHKDQHRCNAQSQHPPIGQDLPELLSVVKKKGNAADSHQSQHQQLAFAKANQGTGKHGAAGHHLQCQQNQKHAKLGHRFFRETVVIHRDPSL